MRLITETGQESRIAQLVEPIIENMGFLLVQVRLQEHNGLVLQIMVEHKAGIISVENCEAISKAISPILDVEDPISQSYSLEISSPGLDRPLVRETDFAASIGCCVNLETNVKIEGRRKFKGILSKLAKSCAVITNKESQTFTIPLERLAKAKLVLNEKLVRESLRKEKIHRRNKTQQKEEIYGC